MMKIQHKLSVVLLNVTIPLFLMNCRRSYAINCRNRISSKCSEVEVILNEPIYSAAREIIRELTLQNFRIL